MSAQEDSARARVGLEAQRMVPQEIKKEKVSN
jgi:hypothetical protein